MLLHVQSNFARALFIPLPLETKSPSIELVELTNNNLWMEFFIVNIF